MSIELGAPCLLCGEPCLGNFCNEHERQWFSSPQYRLHAETADPARKKTMVSDFVRLVKLEQMNQLDMVNESIRGVVTEMVPFAIPRWRCR